MADFTIKLAGIPIGVKSIFESTKAFCKDYLTDEAPLFKVEVTDADIDDTRERSAKQNISEGIKVISYPDAYLETLALYRKILEKLIDYNILLFHGAVVAKDGNAYLFTAKSGTGKTTHIQLWLKNIPDCHILNGDKPVILFKEDTAFACGTPWQGKENYGVNEILPLKAVCVLERGESNRIEKIKFSEALPTVINQLHHPFGTNGLVNVLKILNGFAKTEFFRLSCNTDDDAAIIAYKAMSHSEDI